MAIVKPIKLMAIGASLVTSTSIWMFDSKPAQTPQPMALESSPTSTPSEVNLNVLPTIEKLQGRNGTVIVNTNLEVSSTSPTYGAYFTLKDKPNESQKYLAMPHTEHSDFTIGWILGTRKDYQNLSKEEININLYTKPAWESVTCKEEYGTKLTRDQINELFAENLDEVKVKQLLLSLHRKTEWLPLTSTSTDQFYSQVVVDLRMDTLKDLKIKHFQDFDKLKSYVHEKVKTCTDDTKACFPSIEELDVLETDKKSFFENLWKSK